MSQNGVLFKWMSYRLCACGPETFRLCWSFIENPFLRTVTRTDRFQSDTGFHSVFFFWKKKNVCNTKITTRRFNEHATNGEIREVNINTSDSGQRSMFTHKHSTVTAVNNWAIIHCIRCLQNNMKCIHNSCKKYNIYYPWWICLFGFPFRGADGRRKRVN